MGPALSPDKKLIHFGWDSPHTGYIREHIKQMQKVPVDGLTIRPLMRYEDKWIFMHWMWCSKYPIQYEQVRHIAEDMQATDLGRFTDNFLFVATRSGTAYTHDWRENLTFPRFGWFDEDFDIILDNLALAARIAKEAGMKGILFDYEQYGGPWHEWAYPFNYAQASVNESVTQSFEECQKQVRLRARQMMQAMCREFPDIQILLLPAGYEIAPRRIGYARERKGELEGLASSDYGLAAAFIDGLVEGASGSTILHVGNEHAYYWTESKRFRDYRDGFAEELNISAVPELAAKRMKPGFGTWLDAGRRWSQDRPFYSNHFTPDELEHALYFALLYSDTYCFLYPERSVFFAGIDRDHNTANVHPAYYRAIANRNLPHRLNFTRDPRGADKDKIPPAHTQPGWSEEETFGPLEDTYEYVLDLTKSWRFFVDEEGLNDLTLIQPKIDDSSWPVIDAGEYFENQGFPFNGTVFYRKSFTLPESLQGQKIFLHFGGIAATKATLYVNDNWVGPQEKLPGTVKGYDITDIATFGDEKNIIALVINNSSGGGGLYKHVKVGVVRNAE